MDGVERGSICFATYMRYRQVVRQVLVTRFWLLILMERYGAFN